MNPQSNLLMFWASFGFWQLVFLGGSFYVAAAPDPMASWATPLLGLLGLGAAGASVFQGTFARAAPAQTALILRGALSEFAALLGAVSWYISGERLIQFGVAFAALCAWGLAFPRAAPQQ